MYLVEGREVVVIFIRRRARAVGQSDEQGWPCKAATDA